MSALSPSRALCRLVPALLALLGPFPALAQTQQTFSCTTGRLDPVSALSADHRLVPRILRYGVSAANDPAASSARETREATVTGGDASLGWLRIDVTFDAAIPRDCLLPLTVTVATDRGNPADLRVLEQAARVLDGIEATGGSGYALMAHLSAALVFRGNGSDTVSVRIPIRASERDRTTSHDMKLVMASDFDGGLPFTVAVAPLPPFTVIAPEGALAPGSPVLLRAQHPVALLPGTAAIPVSFRLPSAGLGRWQRPLTVGATETREVWDARFDPLRAEAAFVPATVAQVTQGIVSVTWAGRTQNLPITIDAAPATAACDPAFTLAAMPGGLRLTMVNRGPGTCPAHVATPLLPMRPELQLRPARATVGAGTVVGLRKVAPVATLPSAPAAVPRLMAQRNDGDALFTIDPAAFAQLAAGIRYDFEVRPEGASGTTGGQRIGITLTAGSIGVITAKKGQ